METDTIDTMGKPQAGDITVKRKLDTVQVIRHPKVVLFTLTAEDAVKLAHELLHHADVVLKATAKDEDG